MMSEACIPWKRRKILAMTLWRDITERKTHNAHVKNSRSGSVKKNFQTFPLGNHLPSDLHIEPLHPLVTTVGRYPSDNRPRAVIHHDQSIQPSLSAVSTELRAADGIDVNHAGLDVLTQLPGIGVTLAQRIVDFRNAHGPFDDVTTLMRIKGIGPKRFAQIHSRLYISAQ